MILKYSRWLVCGLVFATSFVTTCAYSDHEHPKVNTMLFDLEDGYWNQYSDSSCAGLDLSFNANVLISKIHDQVFIQIPELNFVIPETDEDCYLGTGTIPPPQGGYVYTKNGFIPHEFRPNVVIPLSFAIEEHSLPPLQDPPGPHRLAEVTYYK